MMVAEKQLYFNECPGCGVSPGQFHVDECEVEDGLLCDDALKDREGEDGWPEDGRLRWSGAFAPEPKVVCWYIKIFLCYELTELNFFLKCNDLCSEYDFVVNLRNSLDETKAVVMAEIDMIRWYGVLISEEDISQLMSQIEVLWTKLGISRGG